MNKNKSSNPDPVPFKITDLAELKEVREESDCVCFGAALTVANLREECARIVAKAPQEKTK